MNLDLSDVLPNIIADSSEVPLSGASVMMARQLVARLEQFYPTADTVMPNGYWRVSVNEQGGVIEVTNMSLSGRWGFLMKIRSLDPEGRKVVQAGGELLERFRISRARTQGTRRDQIKEAPRNFRMEMVPDHG